MNGMASFVAIGRRSAFEHEGVTWSPMSRGGTGGDPTMGVVVALGSSYGARHERCKRFVLSLWLCGQLCAWCCVVVDD